MNTKPLIQLTIDNNLNLVSPTAKYVSKLFFEEHSKMENKVCFAIEAMLEYRMKENVNNKDITLTVFEGTKHFYVQLVDKGLPYNIPEMGVKVFENGLVDSYSMSQLGKDGQKLTVSFKYSYEHEAKFKPELTDEVLLDDEFTCRLLTDSEEDIVEAIKCLYSAYEYDYLATELYYHDAFKRKINSGNYHAIICENKHHQFVGYCALSNTAFLPDLPEFCALVTKPIARGKGIATKLLDFVKDVALLKNYNGIEICPVAFHPFTQKISNANGFTPCGLNVSMATAEARGAKFMQGDIRSNETLSVKLINDNKIHKLFVPQIYQSFVSHVFDNLGSKYEFAKDFSEGLEESLTEYDCITQKMNDITYVYVNRAGTDFEEKLKSIVGEIGKDLFEMVGLYVNASIPTSKSIYDSLKKYGFKFGGFLPGTSTGDFLFFQKMRNPYPFETLVLEDNFKKMVDEIFEIQAKE